MAAELVSGLCSWLQCLLPQEHGEVQLSALGIAIAPMVTIAEILKNRGLAVEKKISTALESLSDDYRRVGLHAALVRMAGQCRDGTCSGGSATGL